MSSYFQKISLTPAEVDLLKYDLIERKTAKEVSCLGTITDINLWKGLEGEGVRFEGEVEDKNTNEWTVMCTLSREKYLEIIRANFPFIKNLVPDTHRISFL